ncbi:MAG: sigma-54-dependent Fis family transcriptional regulator [Bacteroidaceae bacterium]|nr:sigma-54-dependent Fis family transcriptional regulator [Bacteroidaceae bacterium]
MTKPEILQVKLRFGIIGNDENLLHAIDTAMKVAPTDVSVLITGENGVGKESFPQIIHQFSRRKHGKYIAVNCGSIPEGTIDSELFGHEKGAFTGAISDRKGYFSETDGGTIFLDEVGELPLATQARLLRVLENGEYIRVGSSKVEKTNVRIVAATNVNLEKAIADGRFRQDLFFRLCQVPIKVPPLRERGNDAILLFSKFAADFAEQYRMPAIRLTEEAKRILVDYNWPGNVRQLKNVTEQISIIETDREVTASILKKYLPQQDLGQRLPALFGTKDFGHSFDGEREFLYKMIYNLNNEVTELKQIVKKLMAGEQVTVSADATPSSYITPTATPADSSIPIIQHAVVNSGRSSASLQNDDNIQDTEALEEAESMTLDEVEREMIKRALEKNRGRRRAAAKELNISERTLYRKIKVYGLE